MRHLQVFALGEKSVIRYLTTGCKRREGSGGKVLLVIQMVMPSLFRVSELTIEERLCIFG